MKLTRRQLASHQLSTASLQMETHLNLMLRSLLDKRSVDMGLNDEEREWLSEFCSHLHRDSQMLLRFSHKVRRAGQ